MRVMLLGAGGFIGRHILADLLSHGHEVVAVVRTVGGLAGAFPNVEFRSMDIAKVTHVTDWQSHLSGIDIIVNAAGILRGPNMEAIHVSMPEALYAAARQAGLKRVVLISAISARDDVPTDYARSKMAGEDVLRSSGIGWTILRPSLVYSDGSYGGSSLLRGMAGLPLMIPVPGNGDFTFTPIHARDLATAVRITCENDSYLDTTLEPVGPETLTLRTLLLRYRAWLGVGSARIINVPMPLMRFMGRIGDVIGDGPISTNSLVQMIAGNAGDSASFQAVIGFVPRSLDDALRDRPAQVQDRWHARLFFVAPALNAALLMMWVASALLGLFFGEPQTQALLHNLNLPAGWGDPLRLGSSFLDLGVAALLLFDRTARWSTLAQVVIVIGYTCIIGYASPSLWLDPLGSLLKNIPILLAILVHGAIRDKR